MRGPLPLRNLAWCADNCTAWFIVHSSLNSATKYRYSNGSQATPIPVYRLQAPAHLLEDVQEFILFSSLPIFQAPPQQELPEGQSCRMEIPPSITASLHHKTSRVKRGFISSLH